MKHHIHPTRRVRVLDLQAMAPPEDNLKNAELKVPNNTKTNGRFITNVYINTTIRHSGTRCVHIVNRRLSGGYVLEKDAEVL